VHDLRDGCYYCPELEISIYAVSILSVLFVDGILLLMQLSVNCYSCIIIIVGTIVKQLAYSVHHLF